MFAKDVYSLSCTIAITLQDTNMQNNFRVYGDFGIALSSDIVRLTKLARFRQPNMTCIVVTLSAWMFGNGDCDTGVQNVEMIWIDQSQGRHSLSNTLLQKFSDVSQRHTWFVAQQTTAGLRPTRLMAKGGHGPDSDTRKGFVLK